MLHGKVRKGMSCDGKGRKSKEWHGNAWHGKEIHVLERKDKEWHNMV
jgi:hypothetical protein